jgi:4-oxalocrotonate tautomerase
MAIIDVTILEGRSQDVKNRVMARLTEVLVEELGAKPAQVRVVLREVRGGAYAVAGQPVWPDPDPAGS